MKITEHRMKELLHWHDDMAGDHTVLFEAMTAHRDTAALIRQLQAEVQDAWQAGLDEGRAQGKDHARQPPSTTVGVDAEVEALRVEVAAQRTRADAMAGEAVKHEARYERLASALRLIATSMRPDGTWNRDREACRQIAVEALRDHAQQPAAVDVAMVERAFNAWCDVADVDEWRVRNAPEALRAALTAALGAATHDR